MKTSATFSPVAPIRRPRKSHKTLLLTLLLALLCVGGTELAFCRHFSPALYYTITDPVVVPVRRAANYVHGKIEAWKFQRLCAQVRSDIVELSTGFRRLRPVLLPQEAHIVIPEPSDPPAPAEPVFTELIQQDGKTILTGGVPCVYYNQGDPEWKDKLFGSDPLGSYGCGPTAMSMVVSSLTSQPMDPAQMAAWACDHGYWCSGSGSYHSIVKGTSDAFGLICSQEPGCDAAALYAHLSGGGMAVALMGPGHFTDNGHFIALHGATLNGKVLVADPNSRENSLALWDPQLILDEAASGSGTQIWLISQKPAL